MNVFDWLLIAIMLLSVWSGWKKGFIAGTMDLVIWLASLLIAFGCYQYVMVFLDRYFQGLGVWSTPIAFIIVLILARIILSFLLLKVYRQIPAHAHHSRLNSWFGLIPGFANGLINITIIAALLLTLPLFIELSDAARSSPIANRLVPAAEWLESKLAPVFDEAGKKTLNALTVKPESKESVKLPFTVTNTQAMPELEKEMLDMVNEERRKHGLKPLKPDTALTTVARDHSRDMLARGYFSHVSPDGEDPFDRMRKANVRFLTAGENLAFARTLTIAHEGLMNSPGHRANILNAAFGRAGIGVISGGVYGLMISQEFRN